MWVRWFKLAIAAGAVFTTAGLPAQAQAHSVGSPPKPESAARHCVVWITSVDAAGRSRISTLYCYRSLVKARRVAQGQAPAGFHVSGGRRKTAVPLVSTLISTDYGQGNFSGDTLSWTVPNSSGCNGGNGYSAASMPSGWNDRVSSSRSAGGCADNAHFQNTNFTGSGITCTCATMGSLNNETSSELWSQ